ncbi:MAG: sialidase family protein [Rikenellaceae bacterium]
MKTKKTDVMKRFQLFTALLTLAANMALGASVESIFAPVVVGVPPSDAYIGLAKMESGELRHYNYGEQKRDEAPFYISSWDKGLTWKRVNLTSDLVYADQKSPASGEYIRVYALNRKVYSVRTRGGIDGGRDIGVVDEEQSIMVKPPIFIRGGERVVVGAHRADRTGSHSYFSDDDGLTWKRSNLVATPLHEPNEYDKSYRWNHGAVEPTIIELNDGRLWMIIRTSQDRHYQSFSDDGGESWCEATPSPFYGTITMPTLQRLSDGRILFLWCNTTPLPETEGNNGRWEDVFTNRSAIHAAISEDDGKTWIGMRELYLDSGRNDADFATKEGRDKSVHQAQCVELGNDKILVAFGQHEVHRKMVIFDTKWLYETERTTDFSNGLEEFTAFQYIKGIKGHCGYNRVECDVLRDHSEGNSDNISKNRSNKMITLGYTPIDSLVSDRVGVVWNFPAARNGSVKVRAKLPQGSQSIKLILNDRWFNATDDVAEHKSIYAVELSRKTLAIRDDKWHTIEVRWAANGAAQLYVDSKRRATLPLKNSSEHGVSYIHLLGGTTPDPVGVSVDRIEATAIN